MMSEISRDPEVGSAPAATLTRAQLAEQIGQRLAGQITDARLAKWAFDHFYRLEVEEERCEEGAEELIAEALDALMFGDEPGFQLQDDELRALAERLTGV
jgi:hypothetical protein